MGCCDSKKTWRIELTLAKDGSSDVYNFDFDDVTGGRIDGEVRDTLGTKFSDLAGTCLPVGSPDMAFITLEFQLGAVGIFMLGSAIDTEFRGVFFAHALKKPKALASKKAQASGGNPVIRLAPDPGDTGTGGGSQTLLLEAKGSASNAKVSDRPARKRK
jgi:hypothetical protein